MIYSGANNWNDTDGVATIEIPGHATIEVPLNEQETESGERQCVLCTLTPETDSFSVKRHVTFHRDGLIKMEEV